MMPNFLDHEMDYESQNEMDHKMEMDHELKLGGWWKEVMACLFSHVMASAPAACSVRRPSRKLVIGETLNRRHLSWP